MCLKTLRKRAFKRAAHLHVQLPIERDPVSLPGARAEILPYARGPIRRQIAVGKYLHVRFGKRRIGRWMGAGHDRRSCKYRARAALTGALQVLFHPLSTIHSSDVTQRETRRMT